MKISIEDRVQLRRVAGLLGKAEQAFKTLSKAARGEVQTCMGNAARARALLRTAKERNASKRTFHRTLFLVEVLSEETLHPEIELSSVAYAITDGDCSGEVDRIDESGITGQEMAELLAQQASDSGFFQLTEEGRDDEDVI